MNTLRFSRTVVVSAALALGACASPQPRYFTLQGAPAPAAATSQLAIAVGPVTIPAVVDRPEIVLTIGSNEVWPDEFNRWAAPLADAIGLALVEHLVAQVGTPRVALSAQTALEAPDLRVVVDVQRFESVPGSHALVDAIWSVRRVRDGATEGGRATYREAAPERGYDALAAAHGRAVARVAADVARGVGTVAAAPPAVRPAAPSPAR